jgi:hypothetical protein
MLWPGPRPHLAERFGYVPYPDSASRVGEARWVGKGPPEGIPGGPCGVWEVALLHDLGHGRLTDPPGKGCLTGKIDETTTFDSSDFRNTVPRFTPENRKANQALVELLGKIAERKKATPAQVALAWLLAQKPWIVPIPGTTKFHRLEENFGAAAVELTPEDLREIETAASRITVRGARYPEQHERLTGR